MILLPTLYFGVYISLYGSNCIGRHFISRYNVLYDFNITTPQNIELSLNSALPVFPLILVATVLIEFLTTMIYKIKKKRKKSRKVGIINQINLDTKKEQRSTSYSFITFIVIINMMLLICSYILIFINQGAFKVLFKYLSIFLYKVLILVTPLAWICNRKLIREYVIHKLYQWKIWFRL